MPELAIFQEHDERFVSLLRAAVLCTSHYEVLPEVLSIFGEEKFRQFIEIFGGRNITVPSMGEVNHVLRNIGIWLALSHPDAAERDRREELLVSKYGLPRRRLRTIHRNMTDTMANVGLTLRMR